MNDNNEVDILRNSEVATSIFIENKFKMSHVPVETVEEDAADLQFPKGELKALLFPSKFLTLSNRMKKW